MCLFVCLCVRVGVCLFGCLLVGCFNSFVCLPGWLFAWLVDCLRVFVVVGAFVSLRVFFLSLFFVMRSLFVAVCECLSCLLVGAFACLCVCLLVCLFV